MSELTVEQQLQGQIQVLKSRILDTQDLLQQKTQSEQELSQALTEIAQIINVTGTNNQIQLMDIVETVRALIDDSAPLEEVE